MSTQPTFNTVVIGGGQAGLATAYHLSRHNINYIVLESSSSVGDSWRARWDSLRLFTPAKFSHLPGMAFPFTTILPVSPSHDGKPIQPE